MSGRGDLSQASDARTSPSFSTKSNSRTARARPTYTLAIFSKMANWYAAREDDYRSPVVKGMRRGTPMKRNRILDDDELRAVWKQAEDNGTFGALVRLLLLTGQRKEKVASYVLGRYFHDGTWTIPTEAREKGNAGKLVLPETRSSTSSKQQPRFASSPYVFAGRGGTHIAGWSKSKRKFDAQA